MNEEQKYFGMTRMQIGILGGLAGALLIIVCVGGFLILRGGGIGLVNSSAPTAVPTVTSIAVTPPTITPTITPTAIPYEQLIPAGWKQYKTALVEIWMPDNFRLSKENLFDTSTSSAIVDLTISEIPSKTSTFNMVVGVAFEPLVGDSLDSFLDTDLLRTPYQSRVVDRQTVYINSIEARRIVQEARLNNIDLNQLTYVFLDGSTIWYVMYAAEITEYFEYLPVFEQSIKTFRIVR